MTSKLYRELAAALHSAGCEFHRQGKGGHEIWFSPATGRTFTVPANIKSQRLAKEIMKQAGLPKSDRDDG